MFQEPDQDSFAERELKILQFWNDAQIFHKSLKQRQEDTYFTIYDGPPFATGLPHYGHLLAGTIKDVVPRYKTMKGYLVPRRFGWDCHGLPIENEIEKTFNLTGAPAIEAFGIGQFNEECRKIVLRYTSEWKSTVVRMGRWVDFSQTWKTMDIDFMESVWWVFKEIYQKGLVYEGFKVVPFSAKLGTPLSNFEATENYQDVDDPSIVVAFPLLDEPNTSLLIWTTTPWTLISNLAVTSGPNIEYVLIEAQDKRYILGKEALVHWFPDQSSYKILKSLSGKELVGMRYKPPFDYFHNLADKNAFHVIADEFVSIEEGTGLVHTAPAFGENDFFAAQKAGIPFVCPVDQNGKFTAEIPEYVGQFVKDADRDIIRRLKEKGILFYRGTIHHRYPFCWRSDTPLIYKAISSWFVHVEKLKERLVQTNDTIHWMPEHLKQGRFGKWLEGARDWSISRNRYWGTPIPVWKSEDGNVHVIGSIHELEDLTQKKITDLHRHNIDQLTFTINGKTYRRISEVFDCWFDAGSMPYGQNHYPFENKKLLEKTFPADFIAEGLDQTRGWFYTLSVLAVALFDKPAFRNVIVNGILLAEDGSKMSKRLKNYPDPEIVINRYGADAVRLYMLNSPAVKGEDLRFSERGVELVLRQFLIPLWNAHVFLVTYARIYDWRPSAYRKHPEAMIDRWIIAHLNRLIQEVEEGMDRYDLSHAVDPFVGFIDQLTNWYIRRNRRRFWSDEESAHRREAFETLHHVLLEFCKIAAPFIPFLSEAIYQNIRSEKMPESVHLCDYPLYHPELRNPYLEKGMDALQVVVSLGHALRKEHKIKVRQPLPSVHIVCGHPQLLEFLEGEQHLIADELNVKKVIFHQESRDFVKYSIKPNFRILGKKVGKHMKEVQLAINLLDQEQIESLVEGQSLILQIQEESFTLTKEDIEITRTVHEGWVAINAGTITVALDTSLTDDLILEGIARELVNKINTMRKTAQFAVTDRITVVLGATDKVKQALLIHGDFVKEEVLATEMIFDQAVDFTQVDINGEPTAISIHRVVGS